MSIPLRWTALLAVAIVAAWFWFWLKAPGAWSAQDRMASSGAQASPVFTPAHRGLLDALKDFVGWRPAPIQPIAFTHRVHIQKNISCNSCHAGVDQGPEAGLPGVKVCMFCHNTVATDRPEIQKVAAYKQRGEEIPWQRVYGFSRSAHVKFNHAPHVRAGVDCRQCHGDLLQQTVAIRAVNLNMGYCIECHKERKVSIECVTCHF